MGTSLTATGVQFPDNSVQTAPALTGFRNRIINGDMRISQRGTSFAAANGYTLDRFTYGSAGTGAATVTQSSDVPAGSGLSNSLRATVTTADTSIASTDYATFFQIIEGYNVADLVGVPITLSFWVRSSKTGIHCGKFGNSADDRSYVYEYIINTANTWEKKYITIPGGLITAGTWNFTTGTGLLISWTLAFGSAFQTATPNSWVSSNAYSTSNQVNCLDTVGNIFAITGVQLEKGSSATAFEFRPYSVELAMCQRYFVRLGTTSGGAVITIGRGQSNGTNSGWRTMIQVPTVMRSTPSLNYFDLRGWTVGIATATLVTIGTIYATNGMLIEADMGYNSFVGSNGTQVYLQTSGAGYSYLDVSAEL